MEHSSKWKNHNVSSDEDEVHFVKISTRLWNSKPETIFVMKKSDMTLIGSPFADSILIGYRASTSLPIDEFFPANTNLP